MAIRVGFLFALLATCALVVRAFPVPQTADEVETWSSSWRRLLPRRSSVPTFKTCKASGQLAMTFDDGPLLGASTATLLEQYGGRGTYFVNGYNWDCIYNQPRVDDLVKRFKAGHIIGSHTWGHDDITALTSGQLNRQLDLVEAALWKILGVKPRFFRPPYGRYDSKSLKVLKQRGYTVVLWDFDDRDTIGYTPAQSVAGYKKLAMTFPRPHIALNHEVKEGTVDIVAPKAIPLLSARGYDLVGMDTCLAIEPYQVVGEPSPRDDTWTCDGTPGPGQA